MCFLRLVRFTLSSLAIAALVFGAAVVAAAAQYPVKPIDFYVGSAPGGGSDIMARNVVAVIEKLKLLPQPLTVINQPGVTKTYPHVARKPADGYTICIGNENILTTDLQMRAQNVPGFSFKEITLIARLALDTNTMTVLANSPYKSLADYLADAKKRPGQVKVGGSDIGGVDDTMLLKIEQATGAKGTYVRFKSGGESMAALLGGHVDILAANPNEIAAQLEAGKVRPLVVTAEARWTYLPNIPTLKELGVNVIVNPFRGVFGPKNLDPEALRVLREVLRKMSDSKEWEEMYLKKNMLLRAYLAGPEYDKIAAEEYKWWEDAYKEFGLLK
jgi:putative tricarboxylic transport membrane protein